MFVHEQLFQQKNTVAISTVAGMGGVGKTELAVKYARAHLDDYPGGVCWFNARDGKFADEILQFARNVLNLEIPQKDVRENPLNLNQQITWCWQNWQPSSGLVLIILDDVAELKEIKEFLPRNSNRFRILITTRQRRLDTNFVEISLKVLSPDESLSLLASILGENDRRVNAELETAKNLCEWLGRLPLGVELIGRYLVEDPDLSIADILQALKEERLKNDAINPLTESLEATEMTAKLGVRDAFYLTWKKLDCKTKLVGELLSLFSPDEITWKYVESVSDLLSWTKKDVNEAKKQLHKRFLIERLEKIEASYNIHTLIREFLQERLAECSEANEFKKAFVSVFIQIAKILDNSPTIDEINSIKNAIPHLTEVAENLIDIVSDKNLIYAFVCLNRFYAEQGLYKLAEPWCKQCIFVIKSRLGENNPDYANSLNNLAHLYNYQGRYNKAEQLYIQALELAKHIFGDNNPYFAFFLNNLAHLYNYQGRYSEAEPLLIQALKLYKCTLGENNPLYAGSLNNLAYAYSSQGKYDEAEVICIKALDLRKRTLGEDHPNYAQSLNNLANLYTSQGKYDKAEPFSIQALELRKRILGENNPFYANSLSNLSYLYRSQGKYDEAEAICIKVLDLRKSTLGENHPDYAKSLNDLALLYQLQGRYNQAEPIFINSNELIKRILGENNPSFASSLNNLAVLYKLQGRYDEAEPLFIQALELRQRTLGEHSPDFASSLNNLATLYQNQGKFDEAEILLVKLLELAKYTIGENHPDYASRLNNLAIVYEYQERYHKAESLYIQALELTKRILGENHPYFAQSLSNLASIYGYQGRYDEAEQLCIQALELTKRILGENHPYFVQSLNNLAFIYKSQAHYDKAQPLYIQALELTKHIFGENHLQTFVVKKNLVVCWGEGYEKGHFTMEQFIQNPLVFEIMTEVEEKIKPES